MSHREYLDWRDYYEREPWGYEVENYRNALILCAIYNASTKFKSNHRPDQFMPKKRRAQTPAEQIALLKSLV